MRTSKGPRYYPTKNGWFANINGERIRLTTGPKKPTKREAEEKYRAEMEARRVEVAGDRSTVWSILNAYLNDVQNKVENGDMAASTLTMHKYILMPFNEACGALIVRQLRPQHVTDWLARMRQPRWSEKLKRSVKWGDQTVKMGRDIVKRAFRWAVDEAGLLSRSPLDRHGKGKREKRKRRRPSESRVAILDTEYEMLMEQAMRRSKKGFAHLLTFLYRTGARPAEMHGVKASEWDESRQAFVIPATPDSRGRYKLAYLGQPRVIYIPDDLVPLAKQLMSEYPDGPIFRNESGKPWTNVTLCARFTSIKRAANRTAATPVRKEVTSYSPRHAYVTRWIKQDRPLWKLCELLNTSESMIRQHYSHLFEETDSLRDALNDFDRGTEGASSASASASPCA